MESNQMEQSNQERQCDTVRGAVRVPSTSNKAIKSGFLATAIILLNYCCHKVHIIKKSLLMRTKYITHMNCYLNYNIS